MIKVVGVSPFSKRALHVEKVREPVTTLTGEEVIPVTYSVMASHGTFRAVQTTTEGTSIIVSPPSAGSILLTDLFLSSNKVNNAVITIRFNDGTYTVPIIAPAVTDAPANLASSLAGRWQGWQDARLELVVSGGTGHQITASAGYVKMPFGLPYLEWDARR